jgi:hypothetical protein
MKKTILIILSILNLIATGSVGFLFYHFEILWGMPRYTLTCEIPLIIAFVASLAAIVLLVIKKKWFWGVPGFVISAGVIFLLFTQTVNLGPVITYPSSALFQDQSLTDEDRILAIILANMTQDNNTYVTVDPVNKIQNDLPKRYLVENFKNTVPDSSSLVDRFIEVNNSPGRLHLASNPDEGYVIDYNGEFAKYFEAGGSGWDGWRASYPNARGYAQISVPGYDPSTGYVLVYIGVQGDYLMGYGQINLYRYKHGKLLQIDEVGLWIS